MRKPTWHGGLPWTRLRQWYRSLRAALFTTPEPVNRPAVTVDVNVDELERKLGQQSFAPNWEYSYRKKGEDLNLARVVYWDDHGHVDDAGDPIVWWQTHTRGWRRDDQLVSRAHWEPEPTEHPQAHLDGVGHSLEGGMTRLYRALDEAGIDYVKGDQTDGPR